MCVGLSKITGMTAECKRGSCGQTHGLVGMRIVLANSHQPLRLHSYFGHVERQRCKSPRPWRERTSEHGCTP